jgi:single-strand DNA-binding protein
MASLNRVFFMGNLTRDPETRYLPNGTPVCTLPLASSRSFTGKGGEEKEEVCFVDVVVFGKPAESCGQYLTKGRQVLVEGRLSYRRWDGKDGAKHSKHEILADRVQFIGGPKRAEGAAKPAEKEVPF